MHTYVLILITSDSLFCFVVVVAIYHLGGMIHPAEITLPNVVTTSVVIIYYYQAAAIDQHARVGLNCLRERSPWQFVSMSGASPASFLTLPSLPLTLALSLCHPEILFRNIQNCFVVVDEFIATLFSIQLAKNVLGRRDSLFGRWQSGQQNGDKRCSRIG